MRLVAHTLSGLFAVWFLVGVGCGGIATEGKGGGSGGTVGSGGSGGTVGTGGSGGSSGMDGSGGSSGTGGSGGTVGAGGSKGSGGSGGSKGSPVDASMPGCPSSPPSEAETCAPPGLWCEYGRANNPYCNKLFQCSAAMTWHDMSTSGTCPPLTASCPASYEAAMAAGGKCPFAGQMCEYSEGTCNCTNTPRGLPITDGPVWSCGLLSSGCVSPRPTLGTPCSGHTTCDYGACSGGVAESCVDGDWAIAMTPCGG